MKHVIYDFNGVLTEHTDDELHLYDKKDWKAYHNSQLSSDKRWASSFNCAIAPVQDRIKKEIHNGEKHRHRIVNHIITATPIEYYGKLQEFIKANKIQINGRIMMREEEDTTPAIFVKKKLFEKLALHYHERTSVMRNTTAFEELRNNTLVAFDDKWEAITMWQSIG